MNRRKFITTCTSCACASFGAMLINNAQKNRIYNLNEPELNRIEVHIAKHCNLNCKYCCNYSSVAEKEFYNFDKFKKDIERMSFLLDKKLTEFAFSGGEPLLNPKINEYVKIARRGFPDSAIAIRTNAVLLDDMGEDFWVTLNENSINIIPTIYPIKLNWESVIDKAKKYKVNIFGRKPLANEISGNLTVDNLKEFQVKTFDIRLLKKQGTNYDNRRCMIKFKCNTLYEGKLYPCPPIECIRHLNKKFNTDFKVTQNDYIDIYKIKNLSEIKNFMRNPSLPFCNYCGEIKRGLKWETSAKHDISEWT